MASQALSRITQLTQTEYKAMQSSASAVIAEEWINSGVLFFPDCFNVCTFGEEADGDRPPRHANFVLVSRAIQTNIRNRLKPLLSGLAGSDSVREQRMVSFLSILLGDVMACLRLDTILMVKKILKDLRAKVRSHIRTANTANNTSHTFANIDYAHLASWGLDAADAGTLADIRTIFSTALQRISIHLAATNVMKAEAPNVLQKNVHALMTSAEVQAAAESFQAIQSAISTQTTLLRPPESDSKSSERDPNLPNDTNPATPNRLGHESMIVDSEGGGSTTAKDEMAGMMDAIGSSEAKQLLGLLKKLNHQCQAASRVAPLQMASVQNYAETHGLAGNNAYNYIVTIADRKQMEKVFNPKASKRLIHEAFLENNKVIMNILNNGEHNKISWASATQCIAASLVHVLSLCFFVFATAWHLSMAHLFVAASSW